MEGISPLSVQCVCCIHVLETLMNNTWSTKGKCSSRNRNLSSEDWWNRTVRSAECEFLVEDARCESCKLRALSSRHKQQTLSTPTKWTSKSSHVNFRYLNTPKCYFCNCQSYDAINILSAILLFLYCYFLCYCAILLFTYRTHYYCKGAAIVLCSLVLLFCYFCYLQCSLFSAIVLFLLFTVLIIIVKVLLLCYFCYLQSSLL